MKLLYIDDELNSFVEDYLEVFCNEKGITYQEYEFDSNEDTYESVLQKDEIKESDILIIDSMLFENASLNKFTGEELTLLIKKIYPFKIIIIISKNIAETELQILPKYNSRNGGSATQFYDEHWKTCLEKSIDEMKKYLKIRKKIERNENIDNYLKTMINQSFDGVTQYDSLRSSDITECIQKFEEIRALFQNE